MPAQDRIWSHDGGNLIECFSAETLSLGGESSSLLVCQAEPAALCLLLQDAILFNQILDYGLLVAV
jgi:hypothetical protein